MLTERIGILYRLLQCNNTDISRFAGCSPGNISRLKSGNRLPAPQSRTITAFVSGVYGYADYENLLGSLCELCGAAEPTREAIVPALTAWLFDTDEASLPAQLPVPKSRQERKTRLKNFGSRLDRAMILLEMTNNQLAGLLNVDDSLVSRYRNGVYSPYGNTLLSERLSDVLFSRAEKLGKTDGLAALCGTENLDQKSVSAWLFDINEEDPSAFARMLLGSLDAFVPGTDGFPVLQAELPSEIRERYWGTEGLRDAVIRFLSDAAEEGGELLLYSDEPLEWMTSDKEFFSRWAFLMAACVRKRVHIKIIHNLDRSIPEMVAAISSWYSLYLSGMIEPYVLLKERSSRFCHTMFLHSKAAGIIGFFPSGYGADRWYDYVSDPERLQVLEEEFRGMLSSSEPFLRIYTKDAGEAFRSLRMEQAGTRSYLVNEFPVVTMPEDLLLRILLRMELPEKRREQLIREYRGRRDRFLETLRTEPVHMLLSCPAARHQVNFSLDLIDLVLDYTAEEYAEHLAAIASLVRNERNFHLSLLPEAPFRGIQLIAMKDATAAIRCGELLTAFVFMNPMLTVSVASYLDMLTEQYAMDRVATIERLESAE